MKRFLKVALSALLGLVVLVALVVAWLTMTTSGARWLARQAQRFEPRLALEVAEGSLAFGLTVHALRWDDGTFALDAGAAQLGWTPQCLPARTLCLDLVRLDDATLTIRDSADDERPATDVPPEEPAPPEPAAKLRLPVIVTLELLQARNLQLETPAVRASLASLQASGEASGSAVTLRWGRLQGLRLELLASGEEPAPRESVWPLPRIDLPLDLRVDGLLLEDADIVAAGGSWHIDMVALNADLKGPALNLRKLQVQMLEGQLEASGEMTLADTYPLALRLKGRLTHAELAEPVELDGSLAGDLKQLAAKAELSGGVRLSAGGSIAPLDPRLPFQLDAHWPALSWPLRGEPQVSVRNGLLTAQGSLDGYRVSLAGTVSGPDLPEGRWKLQGNGDLNGFELARLEGEVLDGSLEASGKFDWRKGVRWQAHVRFRDLNPGVVVADYPGRLSGEASSEGQLREDGRLRLQVSSPGIRGRLRGYPAGARGRVERGLDGQWRLRGLELRSGPNRVVVDGSVDRRLALEGSFDLPRLAALLPQVKGAAAGSFKVGGSLEAPDIALELDGRDLQVDQAAVATLRLRGEIQQLGYGDGGRVRFSASGVRWQDERFGVVEGELIGGRRQHALTLRVAGGRFGGDLHLAGSLSEQLDWRGELLGASLALPPQQRWQLQTPAALLWRQRAQRLTVAAHCWQQQQARLCLNEEAVIGQRGAARVSLEAFQLAWLRAWWPEGVDWQAPLDADLALSWAPGAMPTLALRAVSREGQVHLSQEDEDQPLALGYRRLEADLRVERQELILSLALDSDALGSGSLDARTMLQARPRPLQGEVVLRGLRLEVIKPFLPQVQSLAGVVEAEGRFFGSLDDPRVVGKVRLAGGQVAAQGLPVTLANIELAADIHDTRADLSGSFNSGEGRGQLRGQAAWRGERWTLDLGLTGERLLLVYPPLARLEFSPDLEIRLAPQQAAVKGKVRIPRGQITIEELPEGAVAVSDDVVVVRTAQGEAPAEAEAPLPGWSITSEVEVILGNNVRIKGQGLSGRLAGDLGLRQRPHGPVEALGELRIEEGRYTAYGQDLTIRRGLLLFSGPIDEPSLDIEAVRVVNDVVAGLRAEGHVSSPQVSLFSEPGMSQEDILSYIVRGRPMRESGPGATQQQLLAQAALSLGVFGGKNLANSLASTLGIQDFELGTGGDGDTTQVELSGYLSPNLFVRYGIGVFAPVNTLTLRYRLSPRFYVEAVSSLESALDLFYEFRF